MTSAAQTRQAVWGRLPSVAVLVGLLVVVAGLAPVTEAVGQGSDLSGVPRADCGPGSDPETAEQGRVPASDYESGRADQPYSCNMQLLGHHGSSGGFKVHRFTDDQDQECAYYDTTALFPTDAVTQTSDGAGVVVLDMTDPAKPVATTTLMTPAMLSPHESLELNYARGLLAAVTGNALTEPGIVDIYDLNADCTQPLLASSSPVGVLGHESGFAPDGMTFYTASTALDSVVGLDVSDPAAPTPVWFGNVNSHGIQISDDGSRAYMTPLQVPGSQPDMDSGLMGGLAIYDVTQVRDRVPDPEVPLISMLSWPEASIAQTAIPVTIDGRPYLVEMDEYVDFSDFLDPLGAVPGVGRIIDISDETNPEVVSAIRLEVHDPAIRPGLAVDPGARQPYQGYSGHYCAVPQRTEPGIVACSMNGSGLRVFDIRDPLQPREIAYYNAPVDLGARILNPQGAPWAMSAPAFVPERGEIWYSDTASGFWALQVTNDVWPFAQEDAPTSEPTPVATTTEMAQTGGGSSTGGTTGGSTGTATGGSSTVTTAMPATGGGRQGVIIGLLLVGGGAALSLARRRRPQRRG